MRLAMKIAWRFLKSSRSQSLLIIAGIMIGVSVQIFIGLLIQGLQNNLINETIGNSSQLTIRSNRTDNVIIDPETVVEKIKNSEYSNEITAIVPVVEAPGIIRLEKRDYSTFIRGFDFKEADKIYGLTQSMIDGDLPAGQNEVLIGSEMAEELSIKKGDELTVIIPPNVLFPKKVMVSGIFKLGFGSANRSWILSDLKTLQLLTNKPNTSTVIEMQIKNPFDADILSTALYEYLENEEIKMSDWKVENADLLSALNGQSISSIMIQVFVMVSVALAIASVLAISVMQKSKQLGILKAMGIKDIMAGQIFVFEGLILGLFGAFSGAVLGVGLIWLFTTFAVNPDGTAVVPVYINYGFILISMVIAVTSAVVSATIPGRKSAGLNPIEVIKNG
ncbi:MAG TPA: ABC transporter permease [Thermotogota bacterium]|mgnify:CR=1 FL=1|nr:ABC transporter permease [Thermotogota bacterium]HPJ87974.1 ABC transporter permease [Thermotogota bacterium]HPR95061.1 ABC transporter permease [Thermotogota bacterium]